MKCPNCGYHYLDKEHHKDGDCIDYENPPTNREHRVKSIHKKLNCNVCPPNKGENAKRKAKHGNKKPRYKDKR